MPSKKYIRHFLLSLTLMSLCGCTGIARGVTEALLEQKKEDLRQCDISGPSFTGVGQSLEQQLTQTEKNSITKVLVVHGISKHEPGYSTRFKDKLMRAANLDIASDGYKEVIIQHQDFIKDDGSMEDLGVLRITRHQNQERTKELLFYELTWSLISDPEREAIAFDTSGEYSFKRAGVNNTIKTFFNETIPDLMVYRGNSKEKINSSVAQAVCWTFSGGWDSLPKEGQHFCDATNQDFSENIINDDYFFVTHSLGSQITVDTIAYSTDLSARLGDQNEKAEKFFKALQDKEFQVYMLSNQLPLLQLGLNDPEILGEENAYCTPEGDKYQKRIFDKINLIAFSDPNDILSYPIPPNYGEKHIDSRLCADIINVNINVAHVQNAFGLDFANPLDAHGEYWEDERVIALIKDGVSRNTSPSIITDKCNWVETTNQ